MPFRVASIEDVEIAAIKVRFGGNLRSIWVRLKNHIQVEEFNKDFGTNSQNFKAPNGSCLKINPEDTTDCNLSFIIRYEFYQPKKGWQPSSEKKLPRKTHVLPVDSIRLGLGGIEIILKSYFGPRVS